MNIDNLTEEQLAGHSLQSLTVLQEKLTKAIASRKDLEKIDLANKIYALVDGTGFTVDELLAAKRVSEEKKKPAKIKYRNHDNPEQTWTGKGLAPKWLREATGGEKEKREAYKVD